MTDHKHSSSKFGLEMLTIFKDNNKKESDTDECNPNRYCEPFACNPFYCIPDRGQYKDEADQNEQKPKP